LGGPFLRLIDVKHYERIVIGLGGVGSAALYHLARRGIRTLGLEQFTIAHDHGSSHGHTRIIRQAYFEHPAYVRLLQRADTLWCELQDETGQRLFDRVGLIEVGPPDGIVLPGVERSVAEHRLPILRLTAAELQRDYPGFNVPEGMHVVVEPTAGLLHVERCVAAHARRAQDLGAVIATDEDVVQIEPRDRQIHVRTTRNHYCAEGAVLCAGAWSPALLEDFPLRVVRKHLHWFHSPDPRMHVDQGCPVFFYEMPNGYFYGFPAIDELGVKLAEHSGGESVDDPSRVPRDADPTDDARVFEFVRQCLPLVTGQRLHHAVCMYTLTPDEHFIVDGHPRWTNVVVAAGLSGHGFKFAPVLGEILADLSLHGHTAWNIEFLRAGRFRGT
jgi:sarcosine oxidase